MLVLFFTALLAPTSAFGEPTKQERYLAIFLKMSDSEQSVKIAEYHKALEGFKDCYTRLAQLHQEEPDWESALVLQRLNDCKAAILSLQQKPSANLAAAPEAPFDFSKVAPADETTPKIKYQWNEGITTTIFWIGEGGSTGSAWDPHWVSNNGGADDPWHRSGYAPANHAPKLNPFYVALPFNDLAYPDKARQLVPASWIRPPKDGKPVSACKDRWLEIKDSLGRTCYAQWEDVGPLPADRADYVFGNKSPGSAHTPGLSVSPAVATYLGMDGTTITSWRFVEAHDVRPGDWLKYDELALMYNAMHQPSVSK